jgi:hypothetical protein
MSMRVAPASIEFAVASTKTASKDGFGKNSSAALDILTFIDFVT